MLTTDPINPWVLLMTCGDEWKPVGRFPTNKAAWDQVDVLKKHISGAYFDVVRN